MAKEKYYRTITASYTTECRFGEIAGKIRAYERLCSNIVTFLSHEDTAVLGGYQNRILDDFKQYTGVLVISDTKVKSASLDDPF